MARAKDSVDRIEAELQQARAEALGRVARGLEARLGRLGAVIAELAGASGARREELLALERELRREAVRYRWYLEVQREAVGLRDHGLLDLFYRLPPPVG